LGQSGAIHSSGLAGRATRKTDMRPTGCPWRLLPPDGFPPRSTAYNIFRNVRRDGTWEAIWAEFHVALRERLGREASPSATILDSQTIKSAEGFERRRRGSKDDQVGYDAGSQVKGRKIHALVDTEGLPLGIAIHRAACRDRDGAALVLVSLARAGPGRRRVTIPGR